MGNKTDKPKQSAHQLIEKMKIEKGIRFDYISEADAENYLTNVNNYLRTAAYRKNYQKYMNGPSKGKYIGLDFVYLQELSTIDMHLRFIISKMCLDIEHALKVKLLKDIESDSSTDGYDIVKTFLDQHTDVVKNLEMIITAPFTGNLVTKYFTIAYANSMPNKNMIIAYDDCPVWVLLELLTFGKFISFYDFYYSNSSSSKIPRNIISLVKNLRNGVAHNNCILYDLASGTSSAPPMISHEVAKIKSITTSQRKKKLSCRPMLEFTCLLYVYKLVVSDRVKHHRIIELNSLFFDRMQRNKDFYNKNELIKSNYRFACTIISSFFQ